MMTDMSDMTIGDIVPAWTLGWRLQRSLGHAQMSVEQMTQELGVSRSTLSRWLNDRGAPPKRAYLQQWAALTRVPADWLMGAGQFTWNVREACPALAEAV